MSLGLIRGAAALSFEGDHSKDSERLHTLISMATWAIWKSGNKNALHNQDVAAAETREALKDLMRKSWNVKRFMEGSRRLIRQRELRACERKRFAEFDLKIGPFT